MATRLRDFCIAFVLLLVLLPLLLLIVLLLSLTQRQVFFTQIRPGLHEVPFRLYKFSTLRGIHPHENEHQNQLVRLTPLGKYLRKSSLDEVPQLFNVLRGDMALVGPRPLLMEYLSRYKPHQRQRHSVRPGITGYAQVQGRNTISFTQRFELDLYYVQHQSQWLDLQILYWTLVAVFRTHEVTANARNTMDLFDGDN